VGPPGFEPGTDEIRVGDVRNEAATIHPNSCPDLSVNRMTVIHFWSHLAIVGKSTVGERKNASHTDLHHTRYLVGNLKE